MAAAWELDIPSAEKMVLLCLCDFSSDHGVCWPSVATIARKCSKSPRTVQGAIKWLREEGFCDWDDTPGKPHKFELNPRRICAPPPPQDLHPAEIAPPQKTSPTPAESAPKPLRTTKVREEAIASSIRAHELPDDWAPSVFGLATQSRGIVDGWPPGEIVIQLEHFRAHHRKRGDRFKRWQDAWSTWVLNSRRFKNGNVGRNQSAADGLSATSRAALDVFGSGLEHRVQERADSLPRLSGPIGNGRSGPP